MVVVASRLPPGQYPKMDVAVWNHSCSLPGSGPLGGGGDDSGVGLAVTGTGSVAAAALAAGWWQWCHGQEDYSLAYTCYMPFDTTESAFFLQIALEVTLWPAIAP